MFDVNAVSERLLQFGYTVKEADENSVSFAVQKVMNKIKNICNISEVPDGLCHIAIDMAVGEFLLGKRVFAPADIENIDIDAAVKSVQTGDSTVQFDTALSGSAKLDGFIEYLMDHGKDELCHYRKLKW